jgi:nicotinate phosphoribosyltransferase
MPEGTPFFADEPILRVTAPIGEAQLLESRLINILHLHTLLASKAVRCRLAAPGRLLVDFGMRRAHGAEAAMAAARSSYLAGFAGTATVLAGMRYGIPTYGTMAHSYIETHDHEAAAFAGFAQAQPGNVVLLIDTYDTERGAERVVELAPRLAREGIAVRAVRLDSGDLAAHARRVRAILDRGGLGAVKVFASGSLDEHALARFASEQAPIDGFGIGTRMDTSADSPYLDCAYKLTEYAGRGRRKCSEHKATWPGRKQVHRRFDGDGLMAGDTVTLADEPAEGTPLLQPVMSGGRRLEAKGGLEQARQRLEAELERLPPALRSLEPAPRYPVAIAPALRRLAEAVDHGMATAAGG